MTFQEIFTIDIKWILFQRNMHCCHDDVTSSCRNCYVMCGHNIIYDWLKATLRDKTINLQTTMFSSVFSISFALHPCCGHFGASLLKAVNQTLWYILLN